VSAKHAFRAPVRLYDRLFSRPFPSGDLARELNPGSLKNVENAALEPALKDALPEDRFQFERTGYFVADRVLSKPGTPVFNRTVTLRDSWAKIEQEALAATAGTAGGG
jgi:glutaminyl-tRNA synthetase